MAKKYADLAAELHKKEGWAEARLQAEQDYRDEVVAFRLAELRKAQGIDQTELASRMGMTQSGVSNLERSADPKLSTLTKYAAALGGVVHVSIEIDGRHQELAV